MKRLEKIIKDERNIGLDFVVHIQNKSEFDDLIEVLTKLDFEIQFTLEECTLKEWMKQCAEEENYDTCFRIRNRENDKCVAYNPSIEHWRMFCNDIFEMCNGELEFSEGNYDLRSALMEAKRIWKLINNEDFGANHFRGFKFSNKMSEKEIAQCLIKQSNKTVSEETEEANGKVKWFNNKLGYGFIRECDSREFFVHYRNILSNKRFKKLYKGQKVHFDILETDKGTQAINVVMVC